MMEALVFLLLGVFLTLAAVFLRRRYAEFSGQSVDDYTDDIPEFDLKKHLNGAMICEGVIFGPLGRMSSTFIADFDITWDGDVGRMTEQFRYNDGARQDRCWVITLGTEGRFTVAADDVPDGGKGATSGAAVQLCYRILLPETAGAHLLDAVDWMYLTPDGTILNRSQFRKYGFKVAELVASIRPKEAT